MDDAYPQSIRNTLVESTGYGSDSGILYLYHHHDDLGFLDYHPLNQIKSYIAQVKQGKASGTAFESR